MSKPAIVAVDDDPVIAAAITRDLRSGDVYIVGGANSAAQAALNLSRFAKRVVLVVWAATLAGRCRGI